MLTKEEIGIVSWVNTRKIDQEKIESFRKSLYESIENMINLSEEQLEELKKECFYRTLQKFDEIYQRGNITQEEKKDLIRKELKKNNQFVENLTFTRFKQANPNKKIAQSLEDIMKNFERLEQKKQGLNEQVIEKVFSSFDASTDKKIVEAALSKYNCKQKKLQKARIEYLYDTQEEEENINE